MEMRNLLIDQALKRTLNISQATIHSWCCRIAEDSQNGPPERYYPPPPWGVRKNINRLELSWHNLQECDSEGVSRLQTARPEWASTEARRVCKIKFTIQFSMRMQVATLQERKEKSRAATGADLALFSGHGFVRGLR